MTYTVNPPTKTEEALIENARDLFWRHGVKRVSVEEICREADVSKMTFYRKFKNKTEIALAVTKKYYTETEAAYDEVMGADLPFAERIKNYVAFQKDDLSGISSEFVRDVFDGNYPELTEELEEYKKVMNQKMLLDLKKAQERGEIRKDIKLNFVLYLMDSFHEQIKDERLRSVFSNDEDMIAALTDHFFFGIVQPQT